MYVCSFAISSFDTLIGGLGCTFLCFLRLLFLSGWMSFGVSPFSPTISIGLKPVLC